MPSPEGKPETGINASDIYPQPIIRFPYAAPFEFCLSASELPFLHPSHQNLEPWQLREMQRQNIIMLH